MKKFFLLINLINTFNFFMLKAGDSNAFLTVKDIQVNEIGCDSSGNLYLASEHDGFFISVNDGKNWKLTNSLTKRFHITTIIYDNFEGLFLGTKEGNYLQSTDKGLTWRVRGNKDSINEAYSITHMVSTKYRMKVYGTEQTCWKTIDNHHANPFSVNRIDYLHFTKDHTFYACGEALFRSDGMYSNEKGSLVDLINNLKIRSYSMDSDDNNRVYIGTEKGIYYTDNRGEQWTLLSPELERYRVTSIFIRSNGRIIVGTDNSGLFISDDIGVTWKQNKQQFENVRVTRFHEFKGKSLYAIAGNRLYESKDRGDTWMMVNTDVDMSADSLISDGWMPSINFYDLDPKVGRISYIKFINDDRSILVKGSDTNFKVFNTKTGILEDSFRFPDSLKVESYCFINSDTAFLCSKQYINNSCFYYFGFYTRTSNSFTLLFSLPEEYFINRFPSEVNYTITFVFRLGYNYREKELYYYYESKGWVANRNHYEEWFESRDIMNGELKKRFNTTCTYSKDHNYYLLNKTKVYNTDDELLYDIIKLPENQQYLTDIEINSSLISPTNKYIVLYPDHQDYILLVDFATGRIIRKINIMDYCFYYNGVFSYDENFIITQTDENAVQINNIHSADGPFDQVFWDGNAGWIIDAAAHSYSVVFGTYEGVLRLWKPDMTLTEVEEEGANITIENCVFPNPADDYIYINCISDMPLSYSIFSVIGNKIIDSFTGTGRIDISTLTPGVYILKTNNTVYKFVKN